MADLAKLVVRLEAQSAQLTQELEKANRGIEKFAASSSRSIKKWADGLVAGFTVAAGFNIAKQAIDNIDAIGDMAQAAGSSVEEFSAMAYAIKGAGIESEEFTKISVKLASSAVDASKGVDKAADAWKTLGVSVQNADGSIKSNNQLLLDAADAFSQYKDGPEKAALASDIFGDKLAGKLIPFLNKGRDGITALLKEADVFGQVIGTDAAKAADNFNDNMARLGAVLSGALNQAFAEVLPNLEAMSGDMVQGAKDSEAMDKSVRILATGIRLLVSAGVIVGEIFDRIGDTIGAVAAAVVAAAQGEFGRAWDIIKDGAEQTAESGQEAADQLYKVWADAGDRIATSAEKNDERLKKTLVFGGGGSNALQEVKVTGAAKIDKSAVEQFYDDLNEMTKTSSELAQSEYNKQREAIETLYAAGRISLEQYNERVDAALDKFLPTVEVTVEKIKEKSKESLTELDEFAKEAARNTQDIVAQGLGDAIQGGVEHGARGALKAFGDMLEQMALQAIGKNVAQFIFGNPGTQGDTGGLLGSLFKTGASLFGGTKDAGGMGHAGYSYLVGTGAQPELVTVGADANFTPAKDWMGGGRVGDVYQNIYTQGPITQRSARQLELEASQRQRTAAARLG